MLKHHGSRMKTKTVEFIVAVQFIAKDRKSMFRSVNSNLMSPSGSRTRDYKAIFAIENFKFCFGVRAGNTARHAGVAFTDAHKMRARDKLFARRWLA